MGVLIKNSSGSTVNCWVERITETKSQRSVIQDLWSANMDYIQSLGTKNRSFTLDGGCTGSGVSQIRALPGTTGSIFAVDAWGETILPSTEVFFGDITFTDDANSPSKRKFNFICTEVVQ